MTVPPEHIDPAPTAAAGSPPGASGDAPAEPVVAPADYQTAHLANVAATLRALEHPRQIGRYEIVQLIGEGGMGAVYKAEQRIPIRRTVAVKIIKLGMDTRDVIARFESERQALAMMNHPNVARVLDAGATDAGRPYFVMEYVGGDPITAFADREKLTVRQRLELFLQACAAVQHAHQKAIIHRDLKPSNILVMLQDGTPTVKVIDFGVAKALSQRLTERTLYTETGQLVGTPEYMPPEQADGRTHVDVDTRSDVYSLGVVLYELLSGALPFDARTLRSGGYQEIQRIIREVDPPRPSTRLSGLGRGADEVARLRQTPLETLSRELRSELEWIPLKAMRKERDARYATAADLAEDIQNYLDNRPLRAGPESRRYRAKKFLRRNWRGVSAAAAMLVLLIAGIVATAWQAVRATRAEHVALEQREQAVQASEDFREINRFLTQDLLASAAPEVSLGKELTVREAVDRAAESVGERFRDRPMTEAAVRAVLADTYDSLGRLDRAIEHGQAVARILNRELGPDDARTLEAERAVAMFVSTDARYAEAEAMFRDILARSERALGPEHPVTIDTMGDLAVALRGRRQFVEAEQLLLRVLELNRRIRGPESAEMADTYNALSNVVGESGREAESEPLMRQALAIREKLPGGHPKVLTTQNNLAKIIQRQGKLDEAEAIMRKVLEGRRRVLKDDHRQTMTSMNDLSWTLAERGKFDEAIPLAREVLDRRRRLLGDDDRDTLQSMNGLGRILTLAGEYEEAERVLKETVERRRRVLGETHAYTLGSIAHLATVYEKQGRFADAEPLLASVARPELKGAFASGLRPIILARYGICLAKLDKHAAAEPILREALAGMDAGTSSPVRSDLLEALAGLYDETGRPADAARVRADLAAASPATRPTAARITP